MSDSGTPAPRVPNQARLEALRQAVEAGEGGPRPRHRQRARRAPTKIILITLATVVVVMVAAVAGDYWYINRLINRVQVTTISPQTYNNSENILLVGSTTR